jgi:hypothetical protein
LFSSPLQTFPHFLGDSRKGSQDFPEKVNYAGEFLSFCFSKLGNVGERQELSTGRVLHAAADMEVRASEPSSDGANVGEEENLAGGEM